MTVAFAFALLVVMGLLPMGFQGSQDHRSQHQWRNWRRSFPISITSCMPPPAASFAPIATPVTTSRPLSYNSLQNDGVLAGAGAFVHFRAGRLPALFLVAMWLSLLVVTRTGRRR